MTLHYVPAGVEIYPATSAQVVVNHEPNAKEETDFGKKYKQWRTTTRTVTLVTKSLRDGSNLKQEAEALIPIFNSAWVKATGLTKVLANPIHANYIKGPYEDKGIESIIDSGGFQMLKGTVLFVDPDDVVTRYNEQANIGMPLDLPVRSYLEEVFFDPVSRMIRANDEYISSRLNKGVHLALISHGASLEARKRRLDVLDRKAEVVAIAGLNIKPAVGVDHVLNNIENLMYVVQRYHKTTRYFHVLGVTSKLWLFMYAVIEASKYVNEIGADSVSHRLGALTGLYDTANFKSISLSKATPYRTPCQCSCPICSQVDDMRIMHNQLLLESHNLWVRAKQTELIHDMARAYIRGGIPLREVYDVLQLKELRAQNLDMTKFQYITHYAQEVMAADKFRPIKPLKGHSSLFRGLNASTVKKDELYHRYLKILRSYEKFHKKRFLAKEVH